MCLGDLKVKAAFLYQHSSWLKITSPLTKSFQNTSCTEKGTQNNLEAEISEIGAELRRGLPFATGRLLADMLLQV